MVIVLSVLVCIILCRVGLLITVLIRCRMFLIVRLMVSLICRLSCRRVSIRSISRVGRLRLCEYGEWVGCVCGGCVWVW